MVGDPIRIHREAERATVSVAGDLDAASAPELRAASEAVLASDGCTTLVLDLGELSFVDSSGIGCFVALHNEADRLGKTVLLDNVPTFAARVLTLGGLGSLFEVDEYSSERTQAVTRDSEPPHAK